MERLRKILVWLENARPDDETLEDWAERNAW
jgi:hypothetical protein